MLPSDTSGIRDLTNELMTNEPENFTLTKKYSGSHVLTRIFHSYFDNLIYFFVSTGSDLTALFAVKPRWF
jgi:tagatose-1,6-bisphosphate aldolase non-catalytic subunit AgaZ/GatZ